VTLDRRDSLESAVPGLGPEPRVKVTVRLYAGSHELLVEEFATLGRRRRAARAAQLMLLGLLFERATLRPGPVMMGVSPPSKAPAGDRTDYGLAPEADDFLSAILRTSQQRALAPCFAAADRRRCWAPDHTAGMVPPSITYSLPLIEAARSETRNATSSATSSGWPGRPIGIPPSEAMRL